MATGQWILHHNELYANPWRWLRVYYSSDYPNWESALAAGAVMGQEIPRGEYAQAGITPEAVRQYMAGYPEATILEALNYFFGSGTTVPSTGAGIIPATGGTQIASDLTGFITESWPWLVGAGLVLVVILAATGGKER